MTQPDIMTGEKLLIQISDGADPEVFAHDCLINTERGVDYGTQSNESYIPDCTDLDKPAARTINITGTSATISGSGVIHTGSWDTWFAWWQSGEAKNVKVWENIDAAKGGGSELASYKLTSLSRSGTHKEEVTVSITLESDGELVRTAHS